MPPPFSYMDNIFYFCLTKNIKSIVRPSGEKKLCLIKTPYKNISIHREYTHQQRLSNKETLNSYNNVIDTTLNKYTK